MSPEPEVVTGGSRLGDRFVALRGEPAGTGWHPVARVFGPDLPAVLADVGRARGTTSLAVAGALLFEQYAQRLVAPSLARLVTDAALVDTGMARVRVELTDGGISRLAFAGGIEPGPPDPDEARRRALTGLLAGNLDPVADAVGRHTRVGRRLLRGAVAHAIASTFLHMSWPAADRTRYLPDARAVLAQTAGLADLVTVDAVEVRGERWMYTDRATCCLAFRTSRNRSREMRYCSACPVLPAERTRELFERATATYERLRPRG